MRKLTVMWMLLAVGLIMYGSEKPANNQFKNWIPFNETLKNWQLDGKFLQDWRPIDRADRPSSTAINKDGKLELNGMIASSRHTGFFNKKLQISIEAKGKDGVLKVYLFEYLPKGKTLYRAAQVLNVITSNNSTEYSAVVQMTPWAGADEIELVIDGKNVLITKAVFGELKELPKTNVIESVCTIPLTDNAPKIDGKFTQEEWKSGILYKNGFRNIATGATVRDQSDCYLVADKENLYVAISHLIPPGGLRSNVAERDGQVYLDESVELIFNPDFSVKNPPNLYQIISNLNGVIFDMKHALSIGQTMIGWNCPGLEVKKENYKGQYIIEMKIPFASVDITNPTKAWGINICRNLTASQEFSSLTGGKYMGTKTMLKCGVDAKAPAITWGANKLSGDGRYQLTMDIAGKEKVNASINELGGEDFKTTKLIEGKGEIVANLQSRKIQFATFEATVTNEKKEIYFRAITNLVTNLYGISAQAFASNNSIAVEHYPFQHKLNVRLSNISRKESKKIGKTVYAIKAPSGETTIKTVGEMKFNEREGNANLPFNPKVEGIYEINATVFDKDNIVYAENKRVIEIKNFLWLNNQYGKDEIVIPPFTPLVKSDDTISCVLRDYIFAQSGFPENIRADGENVLVSPITLVMETATGKFLPEKSTLKFTSVKATRVEFESKMQFPNLAVVLQGWMEYDGVVYYTMKLNPTKAIEVKKLSLVIPVANSRLFHYVSDNIRLDNNYRYTDELHGARSIWNSTLANFSGIYGNFLPSLWLGNNDRGISFFAESDKGWINDKKSPCFELIRNQDKTVSLQVNFVAKAAKLSASREIEFGLIATPVRPKITGAGMTCNEKWVTSFGGGYFNVGLLPLDDYISDLIIPKSKDKSFIPYTCGNIYVSGDPEFKLFKDELAQFPVSYDTSEVGAIKYMTMGVDSDNYMSQLISWSPQRVDFMLWRIDSLMKNHDVDGIYLDNSFPYFNFNSQVLNSGYIRDDGKFQPRCNLLLTREYLKRVAVLAHKYNKRYPHIVVHNTDAQLIGCFAFADITYGGEMNIPLDGDHLSVFAPEYNETMLGVNWGPTSGMLSMLGYDKRAQQEKPNRAMYSIFKLYDISIWNSGLNNKLKNLFDTIEKDFVTNAADAKFIGYWDNSWIKFKTPDPKVKASYFMRPGKKLIYFANHNAESRQVEFTITDAGIMTDAESNNVIKPENNVYKIKVNPHDLRVFKYQQTGDKK